MLAAFKPFLSTLRLTWVTIAMLLNIVAMAPLFYVAGFLRLIPIGSIGKNMRYIVAKMAEQWISTNSFILTAGAKTRYELEIPDNLYPDHSYLVICNHQSWTDILVLQKVFNRKVPFFRFFIKQQLLWVPVLGVAWWMLDYPILKRYGREVIERRPELKGVDHQSTLKSCERLSKQPLVMINFLEGTRFSCVKHQQQCSPYRFLLKPHSAGIAYTLKALPHLHSLLNITLIYPEGKISFFRFLSGQVPRVIVKAELVEIPKQLKGGDYNNDREFRNAFQQWVTGIWTKKDQMIVDFFHVEALKKGLFSNPIRHYKGRATSCQNNWNKTE